MSEISAKKVSLARKVSWAHEFPKSPIWISVRNIIRSLWKGPRRIRVETCHPLRPNWKYTRTIELELLHTAICFFFDKSYREKKSCPYMSILWMAMIKITWSVWWSEILFIDSIKSQRSIIYSLWQCYSFIERSKQSIWFNPIASLWYASRNPSESVDCGLHMDR